MVEVVLLNESSLNLEGIFQKKIKEYLPDFKILLHNTNGVIVAGYENACRLYEARFIKNSSSIIKKNLIEIEKKLLEKKPKEGVLYNGFIIQEILRDNIEAKDKGLSVVITDRMIVTQEVEGDIPHIRTIILGNPAVISTNGIIKGPARSREYYRGNDDGEYIIGLTDSRFGQLIAGYVTQAVFYYFLGELFCEKKECCLFNSHWQKDMLYSQITSGKLCSYHQKQIERFTNGKLYFL